MQFVWIVLAATAFAVAFHFWEWDAYDTPLRQALKSIPLSLFLLSRVVLSLVGAAAIICLAFWRVLAAPAIAIAGFGLEYYLFGRKIWGQCSRRNRTTMITFKLVYFAIGALIAAVVAIEHYRN